MKDAEINELVLVMPLRTAADRKRYGYAVAGKARITIQESRTIPRGVWGYAIWSTRTIVVPPDWADTEAGLAALIHEVGHVVVGECTGREPHRPDPTVRDWHHCLECERQAWELAMKIQPAFSFAMFRRLKTSLRTYRRTTPAGAAVVSAVDRFTSDSEFAQRQLARLADEDRLAKYEEMKR